MILARSQDTQYRNFYFCIQQETIGKWNLKYAINNSNPKHKILGISLAKIGVRPYRFIECVSFLIKKWDLGGFVKIAMNL